ncbi:uncharacterized protein LOC115323862 [Ixodes scapularis]|uniref:uncharacterized protein LOC115323862 n=1 Tax=Ixodes scapularis TaxID=6945 RepID=UPI001A9F274D|nr:uncharacterized protein LOC115323862 [Ixodes scapularis]
MEVSKLKSKARCVVILGIVTSFVFFAVSFALVIVTGIRTANWRKDNGPGNQVALSADHYSGRLDSSMYAFFFQLLFVTLFMAIGHLTLLYGLRRESKRVVLIGTVTRVAGGCFVFAALGMVFHSVTVLWMDYNALMIVLQNNPGPNASYSLLVALLIVLPLIILAVIPIEVYQWYVLLSRYDAMAPTLQRVDTQISNDTSSSQVLTTLERSSGPRGRNEPPKYSKPIHPRGGIPASTGRGRY